MTESARTGVRMDWDSLAEHDLQVMAYNLDHWRSAIERQRQKAREAKEDATNWFQRVMGKPTKRDDRSS